MSDLPWWLLPLTVLAALGPFAALAGHGGIAWVAIRRFFERVKAWVTSEVRSVRADLREQGGALQGQIHSVEVNLQDEVSAVRGSILAEVQGQLAAFRSELDGRLAALPTDLSAGVDARLTDFRTALEGTLAGLPATVRDDVVGGIRAAQEEAAVRLKAARARLGAQVQAGELDAAMASDPAVQAVVQQFGRRRGRKVLETLDTLRALDAQVHPELHPAETVK
jgi:hypothetical protein